jgi:hypothetical protein
MNRKTHALLAAAFLVSACVRTPAPVIQTKLDALKGHPVKELVDKFGPPKSDTATDGRKTYLWSPPSYYVAPCTLRVFLDKDDKIADYDFSGSNGGCGYFAHVLDNTYKEEQDLFKPW